MVPIQSLPMGTMARPAAGRVSQAKRRKRKKKRVRTRKRARWGRTGSRACTRTGGIGPWRTVPSEPRERRGRRRGESCGGSGRGGGKGGNEASQARLRSPLAGCQWGRHCHWQWCDEVAAVSVSMMNVSLHSAHCVVLRWVPNLVQAGKSKYRRMCMSQSTSRF